MHTNGKQNTYHVYMDLDLKYRYEYYAGLYVLLTSNIPAATVVLGIIICNIVCL